MRSGGIEVENEETYMTMAFCALFDEWITDNKESISDDDVKLRIAEINADIEGGRLVGIDKTVWQDFCDKVVR